MKIPVEPIYTAHVPAHALEQGMKIINIGIVRRVDVYANAVVVFLKKSHLNNALNHAEFSRYGYVHIECVDGKPVLIE